MLLFLLILTLGNHNTMLCNCFNNPNIIFYFRHNALMHGLDDDACAERKTFSTHLTIPLISIL